MVRPKAIPMALGALALVVASLVGPTAATGFALKRGACELQGALKAGSKAKVALARKRLLEAMQAGQAASVAASSPALRPLDATPLGRDIEALEALGEAIEGAGAAGLVTAAPFPERTSEGNYLGELYTDGRVRLDTLDALARSSALGTEALEEAARQLSEAPRPSIGVLADGLDAATNRLERATQAAATGGTIFDAVGGLLGANEPRRYFLAFQSPSEARGGGGLVGVYGIVEAHAGAISLTKVEPVRDLVPLLDGPVDAPPWFEDLYGNLLGLEEWREANLSPTFPVTSEILLEMFERSTGDVLDGVIALDPIVLGEMTRGTGSLKAYGLDRRITAANAAETLLKDIYLEFRNREGAQNGYLKRLVKRVYTKLQGGDFDMGGLAKGLSSAAASQHLKVYARDAKVQAAVEAAGLDGNPQQSSEDLQMVFSNNFAANKIDYFLERRIDTRVALTPDGDALVSTTVELDNEASGGDTSVLVDPGIRKDLPSGLSQMTVHLVAPRGALIERVLVDGKAIEPIEGREGDNPSAYDVVEIPAGETKVVEFLYRVPDAFELTPGGRFTMTLWPQATVTPDAYSFGVVPPEGWHLDGPRRGEALDDGAFLIEGALTRVQNPWVRLAPGEGAGRELGGRESLSICG